MSDGWAWFCGLLFAIALIAAGMNPIFWLVAVFFFVLVTSRPGDWKKS